MEANNELKHIDQKKTEFLSIVSHELRTPLTSIKAFSEILMDEVDSDDNSHKKYLDIINTESDRLTRLIEDLLNFSRLQLGNETFHPRQFDIARLFRKVIDSITPLLKKKNLQIQDNIPGNLPLVFCDQDKTMQVVHNIIGNAIKFSYANGKIRIMMQRYGNGGNKEILVSVADKGVGIAPEDMDNIFLKFKKAKNIPQEEHHGSGLGLAISKEIIRYFDGNIWVESTPGKGSTFYFTLPVASH